MYCIFKGLCALWSAELMGDTKLPRRKQLFRVQKKSWFLFCDCWYVFGTRQNMLLFWSDINNFQEERLHFCDRNAVAMRKMEMLFREWRQPRLLIMSYSLVRIITHFSKKCSAKFLQPIKVCIASSLVYIVTFLLEA